MKKLLFLLAIVAFVATPLAAGATSLGTGYLKVDYYEPIVDIYYANYKGTTVAGTADNTPASTTGGYAIVSEDIFCVSSENYRRTIEYEFLTIGSEDSLADAVWMADYWKANSSSWETTYGLTAAQVKGEVQKAIWAVLTVFDFIDGDGLDFDILNAIRPNTIDTSGWLWAKADRGASPTSQDYITPYTPVPEPSLLLLIGTSVLGIVAVRKKGLLRK